MTAETSEDFGSLIKYSKPTIFQSNFKKPSLNSKNGNHNLQEGEENNTADILNSILPPREYTKGKNQLYIETVLSTPSTRIEVIQLAHVN